jgi:hypothetical protein
MPFNYSKKEEIAEIIEAVPKWYIRYGLSVLFLLVAVTLLLLNLYKFPQYVFFPVSLQSQQSSAPVVIGNAPQFVRQKLFVGQDVRVTLTGFSPSRYGYLQGTIVDIAGMPSRQDYSLEIQLSNNLVTSKNVNLVLGGETKGTARAVFKDKTIMEVLFDRLKQF